MRCCVQGQLDEGVPTLLWNGRSATGTQVPAGGLAEITACGAKGTSASTMRAPITQDVTLAREVVASDDVADDMDLEIGQMCVRPLPLQQPLAGDLRFIASVMKVIANIERIGDYSKDIAQAATSLANDEYFKPLVDTPLISERVRHSDAGK